MYQPVNVHPLVSPWGRFELTSYFIDSEEPALVDTGISTSPSQGIAPSLEKLGRSIQDIKWIFLTHGHIDHLGGAFALWEMTNRKAEVVLHEGDAALLKSRQSHVDIYRKVRAKYLNNPKAIEEQTAAANFAISGEMNPTYLVRGGEKISLGGGVTVSVHSIPGHTLGSVAYVIDSQNDVFVGDAVQIHGAANGFPGYEDPQAYRNSLKYLATEIRPNRMFLGHPYRNGAGVPYGVALDSPAAASALAESIYIENEIAKAAEEFPPVKTDSLYSPFEAAAKKLGYSGDPTLEPSPFFTTLHGYQEI